MYCSFSQQAQGYLRKKPKDGGDALQWLDNVGEKAKVASGCSQHVGVMCFTGVRILSAGCII